MTKTMAETKAFLAACTTEEAAAFLLGMYLEYDGPNGKVGGYIVDCEAYLGPEDEAAHSYGLRKTERVRAMYEAPGTIYLYTMHTHLILNIITQQKGKPQGVMIRGLEPVDGIAQMVENRKRTGPELSNGPGKLVAALGLPKTLYGSSIFDSPLHLVPEKSRIPQVIEKLPRIGIPNKGIWTELPLRYTVKGNPYVTKQKKNDIAANHGWQE